MLTIDPTHPAFVALAREVFEQAAAAHFAAQPKPDPAYTTAQTAAILGTTAETICDYLRLPITDPRYLPHLPITDSLSGRRVLLSDITTWQQRNRFAGVAAPQPFALPASRPARRRRSTSIVQR